MATVRRWDNISNADPAFLSGLVKQASALGWDYDALLGMISHESRFKPDAINKQRHAGLIQLSPKNLAALGFTPESFAALSAEKQIPYIIGFYSRAGLVPKRADFLKLGMGFDPLNPAMPGTGYYKVGPRAGGYAANSHLDHNADGKIDPSDLDIEWSIWENKNPGNFEVDVYDWKYYWAVAPTDSPTLDKVFQAAKEGKLEIVSQNLYDRAQKTWVKIRVKGDIPDNFRWETKWTEVVPETTISEAIPTELSDAEKNTFAESLDETLTDIKENLVFPTVDVVKYLVGGAVAAGVVLILWKLAKK